MTPIACESRIERVVVYARGAVVTRAVTLPEALPEGPLTIVLGGVTALAEASSVRAIARGQREVTALQARMSIPPAPAAPGALAGRVRTLSLERERISAERASLGERKRALGEMALDPGLRRWAKHLDPTARFGDALAMHALASEEMERIDRLLRASDEASEANQRALTAAAIAAAQGTHAELAGPAAPELEVRIRLAAGGAVEALAIEYVVRAARWWPAYTARFTAAATKVALAVDAFVAQRSGEDWTGVRISLSTADLAQDARLPELRSLRFGRAQPPPKRGYRPPPPGLEAMFEGYDRAVALHPPACQRAEPAIYPEQMQTRAPPRGGDMMKKRDEGVLYEEAPAFGAPAPSAPPPFAMPRAKSAGLLSGIAAPGRASMPAAMDGGGGGFAPAPPPEPQAIEPGEGWLDFDALLLNDPVDARGSAGTSPATPRTPVDAAGRGKLLRDAGPAAGGGPGVDAVTAPPHTSDPLSARGRFDHRYDAEAAADVPSSGTPLRVAVTSAEAPSTPRFVAVPREVAEVFREAEIQNPFAAPLLAGPVDVFLDGALLTTTPLAFVDRAGWIRLGLGVEERLRVARNARVEESTAGLLGGSAVVDHAITVDLASSLGRKVTVEVLERVPVSDDKDVEVKTTYARPEPERYTQAERGSPVRRGLRFAVEVPPGQKAKIELGYRVTLPARNEIVGGNRRE